MSDGLERLLRRDRAITLAGHASGETHFVCDLTPPGDRAGLVAALEQALSRDSGLVVPLPE